MEPTEAINALEVAWRLLIRTVWGDDWVAKSNVDVGRLTVKLKEERAKRRGASVSDDLLDYTEFTQLGQILLANWDAFGPALGKRKYVEVYIDRLNGLRNAPMHSRALLPFERDLFSGIVGEFRNLIAIYRSMRGPDMRHYPVMESIVDSFGTKAIDNMINTGLRLQIGDEVTFTCHATDPQGRPLEWSASIMQSLATDRPFANVAGSPATITWRVHPRDVGDSAQVIINVKSDSPYHRLGTVDDRRYFTYVVEPPPLPNTGGDVSVQQRL